MTRIKVTQELIHAGERGECKSCPIALAIQIHVRPEVTVMVDDATIDFETLNDDHTWRRLPDAAKAFVSAFDNSEPCGPFEFDLDIPTWALKGNND
jgi:hypothetical protein